MPEDMGQNFGAELLENGDDVAVDKNGQTAAPEEARKGLRVKDSTWS